MENNPAPEFPPPPSNYKNLSYTDYKSMCQKYFSENRFFEHFASAITIKENENLKSIIDGLKPEDFINFVEFPQMMGPIL